MTKQRIIAIEIPHNTVPHYGRGWQNRPREMENSTHWEAGTPEEMGLCPQLLVLRPPRQGTHAYPWPEIPKPLLSHTNDSDVVYPKGRDTPGTSLRGFTQDWRKGMTTRCLQRSLWTSSASHGRLFCFTTWTVIHVRCADNPPHLFLGAAMHFPRGLFSLAE